MNRPDSPQSIGIAVVERDGCYLVGTRSGESPLPGCVEFPGGKCEPGESPAQCAVRECSEETGLLVEPGELILRREFSYPHATVDLWFWHCVPIDCDSNAEPHSSYRWVRAMELSGLNFPEANAPVIAKLIGQLP